MKEAFSNRVLIGALILCFASASLVSLAWHRIGLATLLGLVVFVGVYRLSQLTDAAMSESEKTRLREKHQMMFDRGPVGQWKKLLGPKAFNALVVLGFLIVIAYLANEAIFH